jgi:TonB-dependent receptor
MKNSFSLKVFSFCLCIFFPTFIYAQGILRGSVVDSVSGDALVGAHVFLVGTALGAASDLDGSYQISSIPVGEYSAKISYIGYRDRVYKIKISKESNRLDARLVPDVVQGEEVVITAQRRGQNAAINQQITSSTMVNVVSEEKIKELPDANAAEAIGRLPGVSIVRNGGEASQVTLRGLSSKFSNITVDGVKIPATDANTRDVDLSTLSQGALAGIELYKTLTPDQDADAIAGTVNLVTRKAPSERVLRFDLNGDYNNLLSSLNQYDFQARYGERFFDDKLGVQLQGNIEKRIRSKENVLNTWNLRRSIPYDTYYKTDSFRDDFTLGSFTSTFTDEIRTRNGIQAIIDINTPDSGCVKLTGLYSGTGRNITTQSRVYVGTAVVPWDYNYEYKEQQISTENASIQGQNFLGGLEFDWLASYAKSFTDNPYDFALKFTEISGGNGSALGNTGQILVSRAVNDYSSAECSTSVYRKQINFDQEKTAYLNIIKKYTIGNLLSGDLKVGGKYKEKNRWMSSEEFDDNNYLTAYDAAPNGIDTAALLNSRFASFYHSPLIYLSSFIDTPPGSRTILGKYPFSPFMNLDALKQWYSLFKNANKSGGSPRFASNPAAVATDYNVTERVTSTYLMNTFNFGQFATLIAGVRVENESNDYMARYNAGSLGNQGIIVTLTRPTRDSVTNFSKTEWLPNAHLAFNPTDYLKIRFAAYKAIARPDYNLRLPQFFQVNGVNLAITTGNNYFLTTGNSDLKNMEAWNYEANTQIFNNTLGLFSVSAFYKVIDNYIHETNNVNLDKAKADSLYQQINLKFTDPDIVAATHAGNLVYVNVPYNNDAPSYVWGFEFEHQMNFGFLPVSWMQNITLSYNVSITRSLTHIIYHKTIITEKQDSTPNPFTHIYTYSKTYTPTQTYMLVNRASEGQPEIYGNAALGYDISGFSARVSFFYQDRYVKQYSPDDQQNIVVDPFAKIDISLKQQITKSLSIFLNINNVANRAETTTEENTVTVNGISAWSNPSTEELYGRTIDFGLRISL